MITMATHPPLNDSGVVRVGDARWRVLDTGGRVCGHIDARDDRAGTRYRALRFHAPSQGFRVLGEFWSARDALECVRLSR